MKRNTENHTITGGGINITDSISLAFNSRYRINSRLLLIITTMAGIAGFTLSFLSLFDFECSRKMIYAAEAVFFVISSIFCMFPSKARNLNLLLYLAWGYAIYKKINDFALGYGILINIIADKLNIVSAGHTVYKITEDTDRYYCLTLFMMFLFAALVPVLCYNTIVKPRFIVTFLITFPFIETGLMFGFSPNHMAFALLISYWVAVFAMRVAGNQYHTESGKPVFVRRKNIFVSSGNLRNNVIEDIGIITLISVFAIFLVSSAVITIVKVERPEKVTTTRTEIKTAISDLSIEKIANNITDGTERNPVTEKSRLGNLSKVTFTDKTDLTMFITDKVSGIVYLKGFTGAEYKNNAWYSLSDQKVSENKHLFDTMSRTGEYPQYFNYRNDSYLSTVYPGEPAKRHVIITSGFRINKYAFTPYSVSPDNQLLPEKDGFFRIENTKSYSFDAYFPEDMFVNTKRISKNAEQLPAAGDLEKEYRDYVHKNYIKLPDSETMNELDSEYSYIPDYDGTNIEEISSHIKKILSDSAEYTLEPGITPPDTELTWYLLKESHKGYCSHFATAAVVLARLKGIPARYAEGYIVIPSDIEKADKVDSFYEVYIHDSRAHAWAEFYIDGYGWLPFEFTPGYDRGIISADEKRSKEAQVTEAVTEIVTETPQTEAEAAPVTEIVTELVPAAAETEAVTDTAPEVTGSSDNTDGDGNGPGFLKKAADALIKFVISAASLFLLVAAVILFRHISVTNSRARGFRTGSNNRRMANVYRYTSELLEHYGIGKGSMMPLEFAEYAEEQADGLVEKGALDDLIRLALKSGFSKEEITDEELARSVKTANALAESIYSTKSRKECFIFRYILNLKK